MMGRECGATGVAQTKALTSNGLLDEASSDATSSGMSTSLKSVGNTSTCPIATSTRMERRLRQRSWLCQAEKLLEAADVSVDVFVGERVFGHVFRFRSASISKRSRPRTCPSS